MTMNTQEFMMQFVTPLLSLCEMLSSTWDENNYKCFLQPCSRRVDIVLTKDGIHTLVDVVIADSMQANLFLQSLCHWHPKALPRVMSGELKLKSPVLVVAPPQWRAKFCPSSLEQK